MAVPSSQSLQFIIITGTSGAGKSLTLRHLEDLGFFCTDNMVPALLASFVDLISTQFQRIAVGVDLRGGSFFDELSGGLHTLKERGFDYRMVFLDAQEEVLVRRFSETRRRHPLQNEDLSLLESIQREKERLQEIKEQAELVIDTSRMKTAELKHLIVERLIDQQEARQGLVVTVTSFGYRYGVPMDADLTFDVRFLPNPYYNPNLRSYTGLEKPVQNYVLGQEVTQTFIAQFFGFLTYLIPHYRQEGKSNLNVAIGCTGGRHRSVAITHKLVEQLTEQNYYVLEKHRDIGKDEERYRIRQKKRPQDLAIVALGGGTGLSTLLRGFKEIFQDLTAVVTVSDDGGSSGRLRKDLGILPPGDIRNCLLALADEEDLLTRLLNHRFHPGQGELAGHSFGNLFLTAMAEISGDFNQAIKASSKVLAIRGRVLPVSLGNITLEAEMQDGSVVQGESTITDYGGQIDHLCLKGQGLNVLPEALEAIQLADALILGPGSLYTSVIPHLLFPEIVAAIQAHQGPKIFICNVMSQAGETTNYAVSDYIETLYAHAGVRDWLDYVLVNTHLPDASLLARYAEEDSRPVANDAERLKAYPFEVQTGNFLSQTSYVRHDAGQLARVVLKILKSWYFAGQL